jgi:hypothetical protein
VKTAEKRSQSRGQPFSQQTKLAWHLAERPDSEQRQLGRSKGDGSHGARSLAVTVFHELSLSDPSGTLICNGCVLG